MANTWQDMSQLSAMLSTSQPDVIASWGTDVVRHYVIDTVNGNDSNLGYVDAEITATDIGNPTNNAIKTIARFFEIFPKCGAGRKAILHIANNDYAAGTTIAEKIDNRGIYGYNYFLERGWSAYGIGTYNCWSLRDRASNGARIAIPGPNPDGSFTVATVDTTTCLKITVAAGGAALAADAGILFRIRFTGNVTANCLDAVDGIYKTYTDTIECSQNALSVHSGGAKTPAIGDTFFVERPGVKLTGGFCETAGFADQSSFEWGGWQGNVRVGLDMAGTGYYSNAVGSPLTQVRYSFCESSSTGDYIFGTTSDKANVIFSGQWPGPDGYDRDNRAAFRIAGYSEIYRAGYFRWGQDFGSVASASGVDHGRLYIEGDDIEGGGGVFVGGITVFGASAKIGGSTASEATSRWTRVGRVLEFANRSGNNTVQQDTCRCIHLEDAIIKFGDASAVCPGSTLAIANVDGGPTTNATCGSTGKKAVVYARATNTNQVNIGGNFGATPTATAADGDILLMAKTGGSWDQFLSFASLAIGEYTDWTGTRWVGSYSNSNEWQTLLDWTCDGDTLTKYVAISPTAYRKIVFEVIGIGVAATAMNVLLGIDSAAAPSAPWWGFNASGATGATAATPIVHTVSEITGFTFELTRLASGLWSFFSHCEVGTAGDVRAKIADWTTNVGVVCDAGGFKNGVTRLNVRGIRV